MKCKQCGAELTQVSKFCPVCGATLEQEEKITETVTETQVNDNNVATKETKKKSVVKKQNTAVSSNPLKGKKYSFKSAQGQRLTFTGKNYTNIEVGEDRLFFDIRPNKFNKVPVMYLEDITAINFKSNITILGWIWLVIDIFLVLGGVVWLGVILAVLDLFIFSQKEVTIYQRNNSNVKFWADNTKEMNKFIEDMKQITNIR